MRAVEEAVRDRNNGLSPLLDAPADAPAVVAGSSGRTGSGATAARTPSRLRAPGLLELEELLAERLSTTVAVSMGAKRGKLVVDFADLEDLERLYHLMSGSDGVESTT